MTPSWPTPGMGPLFSGTQDALLLPTTTHPEATGIFVHSFQYAQLIRDHLTPGAAWGGHPQHQRGQPVLPNICGTRAPTTDFF